MSRISDERRKELAVALIQTHMIKDGIRGHLRREAGDLAKELNKIGVRTTTDEMMLFFESFIPMALGRIFEYQRVGIQFDQPYDK